MRFASPVDFELFGVPAGLLPVPFAGKSCFHTLLFAWFQVEGVALDLFDDVFLLHLPLETTERILKSLTFLESNFCQMNYTSRLIENCPRREACATVQGTDIIWN